MTKATASNELLKRDLIEQVQALAEVRCEPARRELARSFILGLYRHAAPADLLEQRPDHLLAAALSLLAFAEARAPGEPAVRVFSPSLDEHGWHTPLTVVEVVAADDPFLVDSVLGELARQQAELKFAVHPVLGASRSADGALQGIEPNPNEGSKGREAVLHLRVVPRDAQERATLAARLAAVLADVALAVADFPEMLQLSAGLAQQLHDIGAEEPAAREASAFLRWLNDGNFVFCGTRTLWFEAPQPGQSIRPRPRVGLGILRDAERDVFDHYQPPAKEERIRILKANQRSTIHRTVHFDAILVSDPSAPPGAQHSNHLLVGLFSLSAYVGTTRSIPLLRHKVRAVLERSGLPPKSYDHKGLNFILESYPRDELFQISLDELLAIAVGILHLQERQRVALFVRRDPFGRFVSCLVFVPRDRMDTALRLRVQEILADAYRGTIAAFYTRLGDEPLARIHLIVKLKLDEPPRLGHAAIERRLLDATRSWQDRIHASLINELGEEKGTHVAHQYAGAFPAAYREAYDELTAVGDIVYIEQAAGSGTLALYPYHRLGAGPHQLGLKVFLPSGEAVLSDVLPMFENMGLRVIGEVPYELHPAHLQCGVRMHDFDLVTEDRFPLDLARVKGDFIDVFSSVWQGRMGNDGFNKLVLHAGLSGRAVKLLRAYARYLRQAQWPFSLEYVQQTLRKNPDIARLLVELFRARFEPSAEGATEELGPPSSPRLDRSLLLAEQIRKRLEAVSSLDEDRILRAFLAVLEATTRTNFFQRSSESQWKDYVSFKIDSKRVPDLPAPKPFREIFVFSPRVEGIHLRFGRVARGGLRWSDRQEDFRTEVLGLVKAQQVKNAVIVPVGSKGGFVVKQPPLVEAGRDAFLAEGVACYRTFISGLLDLTDNRVGTELQPPPGVVAYDEPDPYLVVAADKGTATFSDIANQVSEQYGFWLGDAFASGGSAGYDHKKMGITARGVWESVKRHFRELGKDIQTEPFTCCAVGDMSGDVFGNGLLLSKQTRLVAAFNHLHVFVDPEPDPETSFHERRRLFELPRSGWNDYDGAKLSPGGGVFQRAAKSIALSPEIRARFGIQASTLSPNQLIRAILQAEVELLFFGGIGTYVKAKGESDADVGDRANDAVRVNGSQLRAKVVGEGANLGMTQRGRIEFASGHGRCNTDFIDNSAGVDCSDHEVNIKILLGEAERAGKLTRTERDVLLAQMTEEVARLVLRDNYLQTQALSATERLGARLSDRLARFMRSLERVGFLDRALEALPDDEALLDRDRRGVGFTRPELCVLLSYAKNYSYQTLLESTLPDEPTLEADLIAYFPKVLAGRFRSEMLRHQLKREIIATVITNEIVNRVGITFLYEAKEKSGADMGEVAKAYVVAREVFEMPRLWSAIEALDNAVSGPVQASLLVEAGRALTSFTTWLLSSSGGVIDVAGLVQRHGAWFREATDQLDACLTREARAALARATEEYVVQKVPETVARRVAALPLFVAVGDMVEVAHQLHESVGRVAKLYFEVGERLGLSWLRQVAGRLPTLRAWDKQAISALSDDLSLLQRRLVLEIGRDSGGVEGPEALIARWEEAHRGELERIRLILAELRATKTLDLAMLTVASRQLRTLAPA